MRKGYFGEYRINQKLKKDYPTCDILRNPICDFMIVSAGRIIALIEVKTIHGKRKLRLRPREKKQAKKMLEFADRCCCPRYILIYRINGNKNIIEQIDGIENYL